MIPKIIHYCWFGGKSKPQSVINFLNSWKDILPNYQFMEWNESNFDINYNQYTKEAYENKKYAFVSDIARLQALYKYGGIYLDTDIEIKKDFSPLLEKYNLILGYENKGHHIMTAFIASSKENVYIKEFLDSYSNEIFVKSDGQLNTYPNTYRLTELLKSKGIKIDGKFQVVDDEIAIFPEKSFSAMKFSTLTDISDETTYTVHHFNASWKPWYVKFRRKIKLLLIKLFKNKIFIEGD